MPFENASRRTTRPATSATLVAMGIDGIDRPGPGSLGNVGGSAPPAAKPFEVESTSPTEPTGGSEALERLRDGEISVDEYLDVRASDAVQHLVGQLPPDQVDFVRRALREQLQTDPVLVELVQRTLTSVRSE